MAQIMQNRALVEYISANSIFSSCSMHPCTPQYRIVLLQGRWDVILGIKQAFPKTTGHSEG